MSDQDILRSSALRLRAHIAARKVSPVEATEACLRQIERLNPSLNAFITVCADQALADARAAEQAVLRGERLGPLHGIPISVKDLIKTKGVRTTGGSLVYRDLVPDFDATVVERVKAAGAVVLGKTNTSEFGLSATTENRLGDDCRNPWDRTRTSGGSSGGAAAGVAAGMSHLALGSDGGGSIRVPSGFCGCFGIKPSHGRVPGHGGFGGMPHFSQTGPITRTVRDAAALLQVIAGFDRRDPLSLRAPVPDFLAACEGGVRGLRIAWSLDLGFAGVDPALREVAGKAVQVFEDLGATVEEPGLRFEHPQPIFRDIVLADEAAAHGHLMDRLDDLAPYAKPQIEAGTRVTGAEYSRALSALAEFRAMMADFFERYDLLITPTNAVPAFPVGERPAVIGGKRLPRLWGPFPYSMPFNLTGQPAASVPCGVSAEGLPIGLHIVGRVGDEATVFRAAAAFEAAQPWSGRWPSMAA
ncbi:MAG: amidase [Chloroflexi bacterium]|nr:amidase [Chloroflexota bacterium]